MSKTVPGALTTHLAGETITLATCWKITRTDAVVKAFTDHDTDLTVGGVDYLSATGYTSSPIKSTSDMAVDNMDVFCVLDTASISAADLSAGLYDFAEIEMFTVNYESISDGQINLRKGWIGEVSTKENIFVAELRGMMQALQQTVGEVYSRSCRAELGDTRCGVTLSGFTVTGTLTGATDNATFADSSRTEADDYFRGGLLTWTGGLNNGLTMEVKSFTLSTTVFELQQAMPYTVAIGDTYSVYAGCDKSFAVCKATFSNVVNFRGEPHVPGNDQLLKAGGQ